MLLLSLSGQRNSTAGRALALRPADLVRSSAPHVVTEMTSAQSQQRPLHSPINSCEQQEGSSQGLYHHHFLHISLGPDSAPQCNSPRALRGGMQSGTGEQKWGPQLGRAPWHTTEPSSSHHGQTQSGKRKPQSWLSTDGSKHPGCQPPAPLGLETHLAESGVLGLALSMPRSPFEPSPEALPASSWPQGEQGSWTLIRSQRDGSVHRAQTFYAGASSRLAPHGTDPSQKLGAPQSVSPQSNRPRHLYWQMRLESS